MSLLGKKNYEGTCAQIQLFQETLQENTKNIRNKTQIINIKLNLIEHHIEAEQQKIVQQGANTLIIIRSKIKQSRKNLDKISIKYQTRLNEIHQEFSQQISSLKMYESQNSEKQANLMKKLQENFDNKLKQAEYKFNVDNKTIKQQIESQKKMYQDNLKEIQVKIKQQKGLIQQRQKGLINQIQNLYINQSNQIKKLVQRRKAHKMAFLQLLENIIIKMKNYETEQ